MPEKNLNERETQGSSETQADGAAQPDADRRQAPANSLTVNEHKQTDSKFTLIGWDVSIRAVITILLVLTVCAMSVCRLEVKEPLYSAVLLALGAYFVKQNQSK